MPGGGFLAFNLVDWDWWTVSLIVWLIFVVFLCGRGKRFGFSILPFIFEGAGVRFYSPPLPLHHPRPHPSSYARYILCNITFSCVRHSASFLYVLFFVLFITWWPNSIEPGLCDKEWPVRVHLRDGWTDRVIKMGSCVYDQGMMNELCDSWSFTIVFVCISTRQLLRRV